jgi:putative endopeptidase
MTQCSQTKNTDKEVQKELTSGINKAFLDTTVSPKEDFYQYACGGWIKLHPLTDEYARYGSFEKLDEDNELKIKELVIDLSAKKHKKGSLSQKISDIYNLGMDSARLQKEGATPVLPLLQSVSTITTKSDIYAKIAYLHTIGIRPFFSTIGEADPNNSDMNICWLWQGGLGIGDRDYYLDKNMADIKAKYKQLIINMFDKVKMSQILNTSHTSQQLAELVLQLETQLAENAMNKHDKRDPYKTFNLRSVKDVQKMFGNFDILSYFSTIGVSKMDSLNVGQPHFFEKLGSIFEKTDILTLKAYLCWNIINDAAEFLSDDFVKENFAFYGEALSGKKAIKERWKRTLSVVNGSLGEAVGQLYVEKYFPQEAKERMLHLVDNLRTALAQRINGNTWMSDTTKIKAIEKLNAFRVKIGYPDKWRNYDKLTIDPSKSYYDNILEAQKFELAYQISKINKPVEKDLWLMTPQTVNAYYNPTTNEICFPAAILQPPFFDMNADDAVNYGAIGVVIGHEMTHGFDDKGRLYDKNGNLSDWWTKDDDKRFKERIQILIEHFNHIEVYPGIFADGNFTLGENIADNGGLQVSFLAMEIAKKEGLIKENIDGFTAAERFFLAYATVWANTIRDEEIKRRTKEDTHSLGMWRVNGTLPHVEAFLQTFDIQKDNKMYLPVEKRANIW